MMAPNRHATSFTAAAMTMAVAYFMAIFSVQVAASVESNPLRLGKIIIIQNSFPMTNLTVDCHSDTKLTFNATPSVAPKASFLFAFNPVIEHQWNCTLSTPKRAGLLCSAKSGVFMMWEDQEPPMCVDNCHWFVGPDGLSLVKQKGANPVHVYDWPSHPSHPDAVHNCKT